MSTFPQMPPIPEDLNEGRQMCFGCGPQNPIGLKLKFRPYGDSVRAEFIPTEFHQGWKGITHGGIIHTILDEAMAWASFFSGIVTVTATMQSRWRRPAAIGEPLIVTASVTKNSRRLLEAQATITAKDGTVVAEGSATLFVIRRKDE